MLLGNLLQASNREAPKINVTFGAHLALRHVEVNLILI